MEFLNDLRKERLEVVVDKPIQEQRLPVTVKVGTEQNLSNRVEVEIENLQSSSAETTAAKVAASLLNQYGEQEGKNKVYRADGYTMACDVQNNTTIQDRSGKLLMQFKGGPDPVIQSTHINSRQLLEFGRVANQIQQYGFAKEPNERLNQYQSLAPASDVALAGEVRNIAAAISAKRILDTLDTNSYENDFYRI